MNHRIVFKLIGIVGILIGCMMSASLPWAIPALGQQTLHESTHAFEAKGFYALLVSMVISISVGLGFYLYGRKSHDRLFLKEAMAVVGLSWVLATALGALPYLLSETYRGSSVRLFGAEHPPQVCGSNWRIWGQWDEQDLLTPQQLTALETLQKAGWSGIAQQQLVADAGDGSIAALEELRNKSAWKRAIIPPSEPKMDDDRLSDRWRLKWIKMSLPDALFESQSGFSTTGATVITDLEDPHLVPHCILFWRSMTHFLGGLGIIVLFVTILGQGSAGKALMRAEMPGPTKEGATARMQHTAWMFAFLYCGLNVALAVILWLLGMTPFDALCHAFGTMATGGFSTYNASLGAFFQADPSSGRLIEYVVTIFMFLAGTNFTLLYLTLIMQPGKLFGDLEWRVYAGFIGIIAAIVLVVGMRAGTEGFETFEDAFRNSLFQVVSIITTTGFGTNDFDQWPAVSRTIIFALMFVGGCAGSTGGGMKVIRHILFFKIIRLDVEQSFHPRVVRPLRIGENRVDDNLRHDILLYFALILSIFVLSSLFITAVEPNTTWGPNPEAKMLDSASSVAATLNNIGPGLGVVGATQNYANMSGISKLLFVWLMMLGRLEIFSILALTFLRFWRD